MEWFTNQIYSSMVDSTRGRSFAGLKRDLEAERQKTFKGVVRAAIAGLERKRPGANVLGKMLIDRRLHEYQNLLPETANEPSF